MPPTALRSAARRGRRRRPAGRGCGSRRRSSRESRGCSGRLRPGRGRHCSGEGELRGTELVDQVRHQMGLGFHRFDRGGQEGGGDVPAGGGAKERLVKARRDNEGRPGDPARSPSPPAASFPFGRGVDGVPCGQARGREGASTRNARGALTRFDFKDERRRLPLLRRHVFEPPKLKPKCGEKS